MPRGIYLGNQNWSEERKAKVAKSWFKKGNKPESWKGDEVGYHGIHHWVVYYLGRPKFCEGCGTEEAKKYEWANISGLYKRNLKDWIRLCTSCHRKMDGHNYKRWATIRKNKDDGQTVTGTIVEGL